MNIVFVHSALPVGGAEILRKFVADEVKKRSISFNICLISGAGIIAVDLEKAGVTVDYLNCNKSIYRPSATLRLAKYLKLQQCDIVQSSQFNSNFHTRIAAKLAGVPCVICEEHGIYRWKDWWHRLADKFLANWCDKIIAVSQAVKDFNVHEIGIPADKIEVLHNCLDTDHSHFTKSRDESRAEFGLAADEFVIGHVGTLRKEKAHDILLQAFARFRSQRKGAKLLLVGNGPLKSRIVQQVDSLGLNDAVIFAGSRSDVPDVLKAMDLFVFPSRNEALGIALLEAMYSGLPVIAARTGGIPEIVKDGETGVLVESENIESLTQAMLRLAGDQGLCARLGKAAHKYVADHHSPKAYVDRLLALHAEILSAKGLA